MTKKYFTSFQRVKLPEKKQLEGQEEFQEVGSGPVSLCQDFHLGPDRRTDLPRLRAKGGVGTSRIISDLGTRSRTGLMVW